MNPGVVLFWVLCAVVCYSEAGRFEARYGRTPFGWSRGLWAILGFLVSLIALILLAIGESRGRKAAAQQPQYGPPPPYGQPPLYGQPAYGQPAYGQAPQYGQPAHPPQPPVPSWSHLPPPPSGPPAPRP
ncbi:hypothetical protein acdb102_19250 [Acidothermaceae bacterium B102]|nr:hypothetical protein acdb102_19250 [Acidothermaceae bacterium B102]